MSSQFNFPEEAQSAIEDNLAAQGSPKRQSPVQDTPPQVSPRDEIEAMLRKQVEPLAALSSENRKPPVARIVRDDDKPVIKVANPPPTPVQSADAISIDLPSRFHFYSFKDLYVRPLRAPQMAKISKAHETGNLQTQVEAISSLLSTPSGETNLAMHLTMADYTSVLYWLRMSSFPKPTMRVTSVCDNEQHHADVRAGKKTVESLDIQTTVTRSDLRTVYLDTAPDPDYYSICVDGITIPLGPETLADTIDFMNHELWTDEEFQYKSKLASVIKLDQATGKKWSWDQRIRFVDEYLPMDAIVKINEFQELIENYGMVELVETRCKGCGSKGVTKISCDPLSFLSPQF